jgi:eukaryotic-like serine/threonine-protein kinase
MSMLTPERWQEISPYLDQALSLPENERRAWLQSFRTEKPELASFLQTLLEEHRAISEERFLEYGPAVASGSSLAGQTVGPYQLVAPIGQGGMGSVWLAERSDGRFERRVAIKFLHFSVAVGGAERFKREGRILGQLAHPHIAQLIDAGMTPKGEPYLVLEYIEGEHIDEYCDKRNLDVDSRLRLFLDVLSAVAQAHASLVVHRDVKPSNVLVRKDGEVKLLDFGIAKLLADDLTPGAATFLTLEEGGALTPRFAAPEQVTGGTITTATDVYALGVLLYLLLTGQHPTGAAASSAAELVNAITRTEPPRASDALSSSKSESEVVSACAGKRSTTPDKLRRLLRGDLDTILTKALKKNPQERYVSVVAFAGDLQRYLKHKPISARPDSFTYRADKFVRRNKLGVALTALALFALVGGVAATIIEARHTEYRFQQVRKLAHTVLFDLNPEIENLTGATKARELLVETSLSYLDSLAREAGNDPALQLELATAYEKIGDVQGNSRFSNLGHPEESVASYSKAIAIARKLRPSAATLEVLARNYSKMGGVLYWSLGRSSAARENLQIAAMIADSIPEKTGKPAYSVRAETYGFLGDLDQTRDAQRAREPLGRSLQIARQWVAAEPTPESRHFLAIAILRWGEVLHQRGDLLGARDDFFEGLRLIEQLLKEQPENASFVRDQAVFWERIGLLLGHPQFLNLREPRPAEEWMQKVVSNLERLLAADPNNLRARFDLGDATAELAATYSEPDPGRAEKLYMRALALSSSFLASNSQDAEALYWQAFDRIGFASLLRRLGKRTEALGELQKAVRTLENLYSRDSMDLPNRELLGVALHTRASHRLEMSDARNAERDLTRSRQLLESAYQENPNNLELLRDLGNCYQGFGDLSAHNADWAQAKTYYQKSLNLWEKWTQIGTSTTYDHQRRDFAAKLVARAEKHTLRK